MSTFTPDQIGAIRYHLGYADMEQHAALVGSARAVLHTQYTLDRNLGELNDSSKPRVLALVARMEIVESKLEELAETAQVEVLGKLKISNEAQMRLEKLYDAWGTRLANLLGAVYNPWSVRSRGGGVGGINGTWTRAAS